VERFVESKSNALAERKFLSALMWVAYDPKSGRFASASDPATWATHDEADGWAATNGAGRQLYNNPHFRKTPRASAYRVLGCAWPTPALLERREACSPTIHNRDQSDDGG
jgi:hypothetical protein